MSEERKICRYCKRNRLHKFIAVFDVMNGCACDDCYDKYEEDMKKGNLKTPFSK